MLSFSQLKDKNALPIAIIKGGPFNDKIVYLHETKSEDLKIKKDPSSLIKAEDLRLENDNKLSEQQLNRIYLAIRKGEVSTDILADPRLKNLFDKTKEKVSEREFTNLVLENGGKFLPIPLEKANQRDFVLVSGPSGSGKSYWTGQYIKTYHTLHPENEIFIFSKKDSDDSFDKFDYVNRIDLDSILDGDELDCKDFTNSLVIFDDIENILDKQIKDAVYKLKDNLAETGRSENIFMIVCSHQAMNYKTTRIDLNESNKFVIFKNGNSYHIKRLLKEYAGLDTKTIQKILDLPSRWMMISKNYPMYVMCDTEIFLIS
jgi:hypothetical protein